MQLPSLHWLHWDAAQQNLLTGSWVCLLSCHQKCRNIPRTPADQSLLTIVLITRQNTDTSLSSLTVWEKNCSCSKHFIVTLHLVAGSTLTSDFLVLSQEARNLWPECTVWSSRVLYTSTYASFIWWNKMLYKVGWSNKFWPRSFTCHVSNIVLFSDERFIPYC